MDREKQQKAIDRVVELFMSVDPLESLVVDSNHKPYQIGMVKFDDDFLDKAKEHFRPMLERQRVENPDLNLNDWHLVGKAIEDIAAKEHLAGIKQQWDKLQLILDDVDDIPLDTLFFELQKKALEAAKNYQSLSVTTDPRALIKRGVSEDAVFWKEFSDKAIIKEDGTRKAKKAVGAREDRKAQEKLKEKIKLDWDSNRNKYSSRSAFVRVNLSKWKTDYPNDKSDFPTERTINKWIKI